jgi:hypothetical protein
MDSFGEMCQIFPGIIKTKFLTQKTIAVTELLHQYTGSGFSVEVIRKVYQVELTG